MLLNRRLLKRILQKELKRHKNLKVCKKHSIFGFNNHNSKRMKININNSHKQIKNK